MGSTHALFPQNWGPQKTEKIRVSGLHREQELRAKGQMHQRNAEEGCWVEAPEKSSIVAGRQPVLPSGGSVKSAGREPILFCLFAGVGNQCPENRMPLNI